MSGALTTVQRCRNCGLVFSNPMPVPLNLNTHYDVPVDEYWGGEGGVAQSTQYFSGQIARFHSLSQNDYKSSPAVLDVGVGMGKAMASLSQAGFEAYGIEPSASFRDFALGQTGLPADRIMLASVEEADFADGTFDFVTFGAVLEHLPEPAQALKKALRWIRPGGLVHVEVPSSNWLMARLVDAVYRMQGLDYTCHLSPLHVPYHLYEFTAKSFDAFAGAVGCQIAHRRLFVGETYAPRWLDPLLKRMMTATATGMQLEVWLRRAT